MLRSEWQAECKSSSYGSPGEEVGSSVGGGGGGGGVGVAVGSGGIVGVTVGVMVAVGVTVGVGVGISKRRTHFFCTSVLIVLCIVTLNVITSASISVISHFRISAADVIG